MRCARALALALVCTSCGFNPTRSDTLVDASIDAPIDAARATPDVAVDAAPVPAIVAVQSLDPGFLDASSVAISMTAHVGNLLLVATYATLVGPVEVSDTGGLSWTSLPTYSNTNVECPEVQIQYWYAEVTTTISTTVTVAQSDADALGLHVIEYSGVMTATPIDGQIGLVPTTASSSTTTGPITTAHADATVAFFADANGFGTMTPGTGWNQRGLDSGFYTLVTDDAPGAPPGTYTPGGNLPEGKNDDCWVATAVALRAR
jgi:hypothetical protein